MLLYWYVIARTTGALLVCCCYCCCCSSTGKSGPFLAVSYAGFAPLLVEGLKELDSIMSSHQREAESRLQVSRTCRSHCLERNLQQHVARRVLVSAIELCKLYRGLPD